MPTSPRGRITAQVCAVAIACALQGCVLDRVMTTHRQLCEAVPRQVVVGRADGGGYRIAFDRPTLTRDDVEWLVGLPPTRTAASPGGLRLVYAASPADLPPSPEGTLATELVFRDVDGTPRLESAVLPAHLSALVPRELVDGAIAAICRPEVSLAPPGARFDIASIPYAVFPDEARIVALIGPPHFRTGPSIGYAYCLEPCDLRTRPVARLVYTLDASGKLRRAEFAYFRYLLVVDPVAHTAMVSLRLP